jgi:hypothetical protein
MPTVDDFLGGVVKKPRKPGDFIRTVRDTPQVAHPTKRTKKGTPNLVQYGRPSGLGDRLTDDYNLTKWTERGMVTGAALVGPRINEARFDRLLAAQAADDTESVQRVADSLAATWKGAAGLKDSADIGTFIHAVIAGERLDMAEADRLGIRPEHIDVVRREWPVFLERYGFEVLAQELPVVNDLYGVAGTCDLVMRYIGTEPLLMADGYTIEPDDVIGGDIKTGKLTTENDGTPSWWDTYPVQLAAYFCGSWVYDCDAHAADVEAGTYTWPDDDYTPPYRRPWEWEIRQDVALIVHIDAAALLAGQRTGLFSVVPVDLAVGRQGADLAVAVREWGKLKGCGAAIGPAATKNAQQADSDSPSAGTPVELTAPAPSPAGAVQIEPTATVDNRLTIADQRAALPRNPDDGADLNDEGFAPQWSSLQVAYLALDPAAKSWVDGLREQAIHAGCDFHSGKGKRYVRRFELLRALIGLAGSGFDNDAEARNLAYSVVGDEAMHWPAITTGHAIGSLDAAHAAAFARLCDAAVAGNVAAVVIDAKRIRYTLAA